MKRTDEHPLQEYFITGTHIKNATCSAKITAAKSCIPFTGFAQKLTAKRRRKRVCERERKRERGGGEIRFGQQGSRFERQCIMYSSFSHRLSR